MTPAKRMGPGLLLHARTSRGLSQRGLAAWIGCDVAMVCRMETGKALPSRTLANRMSALLGIPAESWDLPSDLRARGPKPVAVGSARVATAGGAR